MAEGAAVGVEVDRAEGIAVVGAEVGGTVGDDIISVTLSG
jgi:hypothetical protein